MRHPARLALATACGLVCAAPLRGADPGPAAVPAAAVAPAFTVTELLQPPRAGWITNGGTLYNQRHSPLTLLDRDNVAGLRALWRTGMGSGTSPGHAGQAQILACQGVLYVVNGANDVLWEFMTDAGVNTTVTTFEHKGRQMVVVHAGGGTFADGRRTGGHGGGPTLVANSDVALIQAVTFSGRNNMPTFRDVYDPSQIRDVAEFIHQVLASPGR